MAARCRCGRRNIRTVVVVTIGLLSAMFDEKRLHKEVAPRMIELGVAVGGLLEGAEGELFNNRLERKSLPLRTNNKIVKTEERDDLEARTRRPRSARSVSRARWEALRRSSGNATRAGSPSANASTDWSIHELP